MYPDIVLPLFGAAVEIKSYVLFTLLGAIAGIFTALPLMRREGLRGGSAFALLIAMAIAFLCGARIFNFLIHPAAYGRSLYIYSLRPTGLSVYGGILGALAVLLIWARVTKTDKWPILDSLVLPGGLAFVLARTGCFLNGCCVGKPTDSLWGVAFPVHNGEQEILTGFLAVLGKSEVALRRYPTQLFEMGLALLGLLPVLWLYLRKKLPNGTAFLLYAVWFSTMRLLVLPLRSLPYSEIISGLFYPAFYLTIIVTGLVLLRGRLVNQGK